jgi:hypothetical protein
VTGAGDAIALGAGFANGCGGAVTGLGWGEITTGLGSATTGADGIVGGWYCGGSVIAGLGIVIGCCGGFGATLGRGGGSGCGDGASVTGRGMTMGCGDGVTLGLGKGRATGGVAVGSGATSLTAGTGVIAIV